MSDRPAYPQLPADSAPADSQTTSIDGSNATVPFKDRDFRAASRKKATRSIPTSPVKMKTAAEPSVYTELPPANQSVASESATPVEEADVPPAPVADIPSEAAQPEPTPEESPRYIDPVLIPPAPRAQAPEQAVAVPPVTEPASAHEEPAQQPSERPVPSAELPSKQEASVENPAVTVPRPVEPIPLTPAVEVAEEQPTAVEATPFEPVNVEPSTSPAISDIEVHIQIPRSTPTTSQLPPAVEETPVASVTPPADSSVTNEPTPPVDEPESSVPIEEPAATEVTNGFALLDLNEHVMKAVVQGGYEQPTPIQAEIIPHVMSGQDVLAQSQTGSGKTAAFALPILSLIDTGRRASRNPQVLVLTPTRELAIQVSNSFSTYGAFLAGFTVTTIYGGQSYDSQFRQLKRGVNVVVGTPGRVIDHIKRGTLDLSELGCLVLDEADEMLNMGFLDDVKFVLEHTPDERQVALFSATLPPPIRKIAETYLNDPTRVTIKQKTMTADSIRQRALFVTPRNKIDALKRVLEAEDTDGVIIFTKTREATVTVADELSREGLSTVALNGDMPQRVRERTIEQLKNGELDILVATDVAARGLDVTRVSHVINYDAPNDNESYIHRVGRTGRAGRKGEAIIFLSKSQRGRLRQIERATKQTIEIIDLPTADDINEARVKRFMQQVTEAATTEDLSVFEEIIGRIAADSDTPMLKIAAAVAHLGQQGRPFFVEELPQGRKNRRDFDRDRGHPRDDRDSRNGRNDRRPRRNDGAPTPTEEGMDRYRIAVGWQDGVKPGNIVGAVANEGGVDGDAIGAIRIYSTYSTIDLPEGMPDHVRETLQTTRVAGRPLQLRPYTDEAASYQKRDRRSGERSQGRKSFGARRSRPAAGRSEKRPFRKKFKGGHKRKGKE